MATNFNRFKELLEARKSAPAKQGAQWFKAVKGEKHTLRFLPLKSTNLELPLEIYDHHALNFPDGTFQSFVCPKKAANEPCAFCDLATATYKKFTATEDEAYKNSFKQIVAKRHYLLVGVEPSKLDTDDIKAEDCKIVRASSKASMETIGDLLERGKDFVDYETGRDCVLAKPKTGGDQQAIIWQFQDPEKPNFSRKVFDKLVELSPDLTDMLSVPSQAKIAELYSKFTASTPSVPEPEAAPAPSGLGTAPSRTAARTTESVSPSGGISEADLEALRADLDD